MSDSIPTDPPIIETPDALEALVAQLSGAARVALDVEGDGLYRYRARACTIQVASDATCAVIDPLALDDLSPLAPLLGAAGPIKVVHDAAFDARMLLRRGLALEPLFDTAVAARFLGESATGLSALLSRHLGVELDKEAQQSDWGARPLPEDRIAYLVADVSHLLALAALLEARLRELDLLEELFEETRYAMARAREPEVERAPWTRIRGARELDARARALLWALAEVREREAQARDVPPFRVASNRALLEAAERRRPVRGLGAAAWARALELAERDPPEEPAPSAGISTQERARRRARERALGDWRREEAGRRGVSEQAVLPSHCLRELARLGTIDGVEGLGDKRVARYGAVLARIAGTG